MSEVIINVEPQEVIVVNITVDENSAQAAMDAQAAAELALEQINETDFGDKTDKGGYTGTSQNLKDSITALETPDIVLKEGVIAIDELTVSIVANDFQWRLNQVNYLVTPAYSQLLVASTEGFKRTDLLEGDDTGNYFINQGTEGEFAAPAPAVTVGRIRLAAIPVFGSVVGTPDVGAPVESSPTDKPISVYGVFDKGISLYKDKISIWRYIGVISKYVNIYWSNINNIYDIQFPNKPAGTETFAMLSDLESKLDVADYNNHFKSVYLTEAALFAAHPTASVGDYAQVNEVGATDVVNYNWDAEENIWVKNITEGSGATNTDALPEGTANLYFTTARVLSTLLSGLSLVTGGTIVSTDSVLIAFGKIQKQINDISTTLSGKQNTLVAGTNISIDNTNPLAPVINAAGSGSSVSVIRGFMGNISPTANETVPVTSENWIGVGENATITGGTFAGGPHVPSQVFEKTSNIQKIFFKFQRDGSLGGFTFRLYAFSQADLATTVINSRKIFEYTFNDATAYKTSVKSFTAASFLSTSVVEGERLVATLQLSSGTSVQVRNFSVMLTY